MTSQKKILVFSNFDTDFLVSYFMMSGPVRYVGFSLPVCLHYHLDYVGFSLPVAP